MTQSNDALRERLETVVRNTATKFPYHVGQLLNAIDPVVRTLISEAVGGAFEVARITEDSTWRGGWRRTCKHGNEAALHYTKLECGCELVMHTKAQATLSERDKRVREEVENEISNELAKYLLALDIDQGAFDFVSAIKLYARELTHPEIDLERVQAERDRRVREEEVSKHLKCDISCGVVNCDCPCHRGPTEQREDKPAEGQK